MSTHLKHLAAAALASASLVVHADTLSVSESTTLAAPAAQVWQAIGHFGDLNWHPAVKRTEITRGTEGQAGALRTITLQNDATLVEEALAQGDDAIIYRILESPLPVRNYVSRLKIEPLGKHSRVTWSSQFEAKAGVGAAQARRTIAGIYTGGFEALKKRFGGAMR